MKNKRRDFLKLTGLTGLGLAGGIFPGLAAGAVNATEEYGYGFNENHLGDMMPDDDDISIIGLYGKWANSLIANKTPSFSFRNKSWKKVDNWRKAAKRRLMERLAMPDIGGVPEVTVHKQYTYDGLHIEEISWQLPYGRPTEAIVLKPANASGPLPGILALHDHAGNKYLGARKIARTTDELPPFLEYHYGHYYEKMAWANQVAKRGYVVLVPDAFAFGSRRVWLKDVPERLRQGLNDNGLRKDLNDNEPEDPKNIAAYNKWAADHAATMAKSLFSAGTTWPGVFLAEDQKALDVLCARKDVDPNKIGCGGLSGGGLRTVMIAGVDPRIKCAVPVGFMTTWKDFIMYKSFTHTWMAYVPLLPNELDFPEIIGLRAPLPTLVLNNSEDQLFTPSEMQRADDILKEVFTKAGAADRYKASFHPGLHKFDVNMQTEAFEWFDRWLKNA
ncbi:MAG TPA: alpha/beta hydrolase family protein [Flavitalea sp.]|nr:alpha/beta hydrolase family protein [Flavitalea sp.]